MSCCASFALLVCLSPLASPQATPVPTIAWVEGGVSRAQERSLAEQRPLVLFLHPEDDARASAALDRALSSSAAASALQPALCLDLRRDAAHSADVRGTHGLGAHALVLCLAPDGERVDAVSAIATPDELVLGCRRMLSGHDTLRDLEERWRGSKRESAAGLELCSALLERLQELGDTGSCRELREHLQRHDPKGQTRAGAMLQLAAAEESVRSQAASADEMSMSMPDHTALQTLARKAKFPEVRSAAWRSLGAALAAEGDGVGSLDCAVEAFASAPEERRDTLGAELVEAWLGVGNDLLPQQRKQLLALTEAVLASATAQTKDSAAWSARHPVSHPVAFLAERQRWFAAALRLNGKEKQALAAEMRAAELEQAAGIVLSPRR